MKRVESQFTDRVMDLLAEITHPFLSFEANVLDGLATDLRCFMLNSVDNVTGEVLPRWNGRWWRLSRFMTDGEIVQTAFLATQTALEHELREQFKFKGQSVFDGHYDIHKLAAFRADPESIKGRDHD